MFSTENSSSNPAQSRSEIAPGASAGPRRGADHPGQARIAQNHKTDTGCDSVTTAVRLPIMARPSPRRILLWATTLLACSAPEQPPQPPSPVAVGIEAEPAVTVEDHKAVDPHSFARPHEVQVQHIGLRWKVDFEQRVLDAEATLRVQRRAKDRPLRLDTRDLEIVSVRAGVGTPGSSGTERLAQMSGEGLADVSFQLGEPDPVLGQALEVALPPEADTVRIVYRTRPGATGLQWLDPEQTADGTHPFLYSQAQAIHARSFIPCQDTPGVRVTYDAVIDVDPSLTALMAAKRDDTDAEQGRFSFSMLEPVPAYLIAFAVGRVQFAELGPRSGVWAEPSVLASAASEFADVESMMATAEKLYGPYRWGRYDILVLPPAFPFGGMENPRLTFATPTILAGDRSLVALVAHELAHSWSGNLVTNARWSHLWLNEGFTVYIERRIVEALYGQERAQMEAMLGRQDLEEALEQLGDGDEALVADLAERDPDEGLSDVAYEKGALFLRTLEETYGRERFDAFLMRWFDEHAFESVTTDTFVGFLQHNLLERVEPLPGKSAPDLEAWLHGPGIGPGAPVPQTDAFARVDDALAAFASGSKPAGLDVEAWTPHQWLRFLRGLPADLPPQRLAELDRAFSLTRSGNAEIVAKWLEVSVLRGYRAVDARLEAFLLEVGRRKFLMPLYRSLLEAGRADDARRIYARARDGYHPISQQSLDDLLEQG